MADIHQTSNGGEIAENTLQISRLPPGIDRVGQDEAANDYTSAEPGERDALLGMKPLQTKLSGWWNKYTPICGIFTVIIFMLGSSADFCDGAAINIGFKDIGDLYGQSEHAAWLVVAYQHTTMLVRPWYSVASKRYRWTGLLLTAYMLFAGGLLMSCLIVPPDIKEDSVQEFLLLAISRIFTALGAAGVVFVPSLVLNMAVPQDQRAIWEFVLTIFATLGSWTGRLLGGKDIGDGRALKHIFLVQIPVPVLCFFVSLFTWRCLAWSWPPWRTDSRPQPDLRVPEAHIPQREDHSGSEMAGTLRSTAGSINLVTLGILCLCFSLDPVEYNIWIFPLWSIALVTGIILLLFVYRLRRRFTLQKLSQATRNELHLNEAIYTATFAVMGAINFLRPYHSKVTSTSKFWLSSSQDLGDFLGFLFAAIALKTRNPGTRSSCLSFKPRTVVLTGAALQIFSAILLIETVVGGHRWLGYASSLGFGIGSALITATLLPCALIILGTHKRKHQAIVFVRLQVFGGLSTSVITVLSNICLRKIRRYYTPTTGLLEETFINGLLYVQNHAGGLNLQGGDAEQAPLSTTLKWFSFAILLASSLLAFLSSRMDNYNLETEVKIGSESDDDTTTPEPSTQEL